MDLQVPEHLPGFYDAFAVGIDHADRLHLDSLPSLPQNWRELQNHPQSQGSTEAADREINELLSKRPLSMLKGPQVFRLFL
jgi:hypothetical protein